MLVTLRLRILTLAFIYSILTAPLLFSQEIQTIQNSRTKEEYKQYPILLDKLPHIPSPFTTEQGTEIIVAFTKNKKYALIPVTVANGALNIKYGKSKIGKGNQLEIDARDFPTLAETGLHSEMELYQKKTITGKYISEITEMGRPRKLSGAGFMSYDEDIISVLTGDNRIVKQLCLTHPKLARPLFHVWNLILKEHEFGQLGKKWNNIEYILYNGKKVFIKAKDTKGILGSLLNVEKEEFQESIFNDEIKGTFQIKIWRELDRKEETFLREKYSNLNTEQITELIKKISHINTGEMVPYYIMRYGFYEGHTEYRADPIAISFIFGLKSIEAIDEALRSKIYQNITEHFTFYKGIK